jgi:hypothetical protein
VKYNYIFSVIKVPYLVVVVEFDAEDGPPILFLTNCRGLVAIL